MTKCLKSLILSALAMSVALSCSPTVYDYAYDMRQASSSGLDLNGKSVAAVYFDNLSVNDILFESALANAFCESMSGAYPEADSAAVFTMSPTDSLDLSDKAVLADILTSTGRDVLFVFEAPSFSGVNYSQRLTVYDSMDSSDRPYSFQARGEIGEDKVEAGRTVGAGIAESFQPVWKERIFQIISYDSGKWPEAENYAAQCQWKKAMELWLAELDSSDTVKRSAAEYNLALACYMCGMNDLAKEWLDKSDKDYKYACSQSLRRLL